MFDFLVLLVFCFINLLNIIGDFVIIIVSWVECFFVSFFWKFLVCICLIVKFSLLFFVVCLVFFKVVIMLL